MHYAMETLEDANLPKVAGLTLLSPAIGVSPAAAFASVTEAGLGLTWPEDVYSLSHVAVPFPPDDPLYGDQPIEPSPGLRLGHLALHGEHGVPEVPAADMLRLRWNPFPACRGQDPAPPGAGLAPT